VNLPLSSTGSFFVIILSINLNSKVVTNITVAKTIISKIEMLISFVRLIFWLTKFLTASQVQTPQQEMVNQAIQEEGAQAFAKNLITAIGNLPMTNLIIAFMLFFISGYLLYS